MAIAFDAATDGGVTTGNPPTVTVSHTCTGSNGILYVWVFGSGGGTGSITGVKYNNVSMSTVTGTWNDIQCPSDRYCTLFYLLGPSTGANNIVVTNNNADAIGVLAASYNGVSQSGFPDASTFAQVTGNTQVSPSVTTVADQCWTVLATKNNTGGTTSAGGGTTNRVTNSSGGMDIWDSGGALSIGSHSLTATLGSSTNWAAGMGSMAPASTDRRFLLVR